MIKKYYQCKNCGTIYDNQNDAKMCCFDFISYKKNNIYIIYGCTRCKIYTMYKSDVCFYCGN